MTNINIEIDDDQQLMLLAKSKPILKRNHLRMFQDNFLDLSKDSDLTLTDLRVYLGILAYVEFENKIQISQYEFAKELEIAQPHISTSIKKLCDKKILVETGKVGKQKVYHLHPDYGFKARASKLGSLIRAIDNGASPTQKSFVVEDLIVEENPPTLLEELSKLSDVPVSKIEKILELISQIHQDQLNLPH